MKICILSGMRINYLVRQGRKAHGLLSNWFYDVQYVQRCTTNLSEVLLYHKKLKKTKKDEDFHDLMIMTFCLITVVQALYFLFHPFSKEGCSVSLNLLNRESNVYPYFLFSNKLPKLSRNQLAHGVNLILMLSCMFHCGFKERENGNSTPHVRILLDHQLYILISAATQYMI